MPVDGVGPLGASGAGVVLGGAAAGVGVAPDGVDVGVVLGTSSGGGAF